MLLKSHETRLKGPLDSDFIKIKIVELFLSINTEFNVTLVGPEWQVMDRSQGHWLRCLAGSGSVSEVRDDSETCDSLLAAEWVFWQTSQ